MGFSLQRKTCSDKCRSVRSRRIRAARRDAGRNHGGLVPDEVNHALTHERKDLIHDVLKEELRPVIRESITEEVLRSIQELTALAPRVVELLSEDMQSDDAVIRQRAYTLVAKYTLGHPALVKPEDTDGSKQLVVNFALPRPGDTTESVESSAVELDVGDDIKTCDMCGADKPITQFVAQSDRCVECYEGLQKQAAGMYKDGH